MQFGAVAAQKWVQILIACNINQFKLNQDWFQSRKSRFSQKNNRLLLWSHADFVSLPSDKEMISL